MRNKLTVLRHTRPDAMYVILQKRSLLTVELPQGAINCATTNLITFEKHTYFQSLSVCSDAIYRISA